MDRYMFYGHTSLSDLRVVPAVMLPVGLQKYESIILTEPQAIMLADKLDKGPIGSSNKVMLCCPHGCKPRAGKTSKYICAKKNTNVKCTGKRIRFPVRDFIFDPNAIYGLRMSITDLSKDTGPEYVPEGMDADKKMISVMITFLLDEKAEGANPTLELEMPDGEKKFLVRMRNVLFGIHNFYFPRAIERLERIAPVALKTAKTMRGMKLDNVAVQHNPRARVEPSILDGSLETSQARIAEAVSQQEHGELCNMAKRKQDGIVEVPRAKRRARVEPIHDVVLEPTGARTAGNPPSVTHQEHGDQKKPSKIPVSQATDSSARAGYFASGPQMLVEEDTTFLRLYNEGWEQINKQLRTGDTSASTQNDVDGIVRALDKLPPFEGIVHSGAEFGTDIINSLRIDGATFSDRAFLSTTKNLLHGLDKFNRNNCWFTIQSKTGKDISMYASGSSKEEETEMILFRPETRFRVTSVRNDPINNRFHISMEEIV